MSHTGKECAAVFFYEKQDIRSEYSFHKFPDAVKDAKRRHGFKT